MLYDQLYVFAEKKSGFIFPIWVMVKQYMDILGQLQYIGLMKQQKSKEVKYIENFNIFLIKALGATT